MTSTVLGRMIRQPFIWLGIAALVVAALFLLESNGSSHAPRVVPIHLTSNNGHGHGGGNGHHHCGDGKGSDNPKNKHCRGGSGGQT